MTRRRSVICSLHRACIGQELLHSTHTFLLGFPWPHMYLSLSFGICDSYHSISQAEAWVWIRCLPREVPVWLFNGTATCNCGARTTSVAFPASAHCHKQLIVLKHVPAFIQLTSPPASKWALSKVPSFY